MVIIGTLYDVLAVQMTRDDSTKNTTAYDVLSKNKQMHISNGDSKAFVNGAYVVNDIEKNGEVTYETKLEKAELTVQVPQDETRDAGANTQNNEQSKTLGRPKTHCFLLYTYLIFYKYMKVLF